MVLNFQTSNFLDILNKYNVENPKAVSQACIFNFGIPRLWISGILSYCESIECLDVQ